MPVSGKQKKMGGGRTSSIFCTMAVLLAMAQGAFAAPVTVTPTTVMLGPTQSSQLITLTNEGDTPTRYEANVSAWIENPDGTTTLQPSSDIIVFPQLTTLAPHESKRVRIGTEHAAGATERSYRLILQELPQINRDTGRVEIQVLAKISLPVFLTPKGAHAVATIGAPRLENGVLHFDVANTGRTRFMLRQVDVIGRDINGEIFSLKTTGWYVLAGGRRTYQVALNAADCSRSAEIEIKASGEMNPASIKLPITSAACGSARETQFLKTATNVAP
jgi:fimbrial chaperone protein